MEVTTLTEVFPKAPEKVYNVQITNEERLLIIQAVYQKDFELREQTDSLTGLMKKVHKQVTAPLVERHQSLLEKFTYLP